MEYMKGGDLSNLIEEAGYFEEPMAKYYIANLVNALGQLHSAGVIHRDLKPENILIDKFGHIKLTDFGLSEAGYNLKNLVDQQYGDKKKKQDIRRDSLAIFSRNSKPDS